MPTKNNSPNLDQYIPEGRKRYVSYYEGAQMYGQNILSHYGLSQKIGYSYQCYKEGFPGDSVVKNPPDKQETRVRSLG